MRTRALRVVLVAAVVDDLGVGYSYWQGQMLYVSTDHTLVAGLLAKLGRTNAAQVASVAVDVGDQVKRDQVVATVILPSSLGLAPGGTPRLGIRGTEDQQVQVRSPIDGVVTARQANASRGG